MDTLFAILLGLIGVALLAGAAFLLVPRGGGRPPDPTLGAALPLPVDAEAERQQRLAEMRRRRLENAGGGYDFPLPLNEGPLVQDHRLTDDQLVVTPPRSGYRSGEVLPFDAPLPDTAERRI